MCCRLGLIGAEIMVESFIGERYLVELSATPYFGAFVFKVTAVHHDSRRCSDVTNLNELLTLLRDTQEHFVIAGEDMYESDESEEYNESDWLVHQDERDELFEVMRQVLRDPKQRAWLESALDEDRRCGEWANKRRKKR